MSHQISADRKNFRDFFTQQQKTIKTQSPQALVSIVTKTLETLTASGKQGTVNKQIQLGERTINVANLESNDLKVFVQFAKKVLNLHGIQESEGDKILDAISFHSDFRSLKKTILVNEKMELPKQASENIKKASSSLIEAINEEKVAIKTFEKKLTLQMRKIILWCVAAGAAVLTGIAVGIGMGILLGPLGVLIGAPFLLAGIVIYRTVAKKNMKRSQLLAKNISSSVKHIEEWKKLKQHIMEPRFQNALAVLPPDKQLNIVNSIYNISRFREMILDKEKYQEVLQKTVEATKEEVIKQFKTRYPGMPEEAVETALKKILEEVRAHPEIQSLKSQILSEEQTLGLIDENVEHQK